VTIRLRSLRRLYGYRIRGGGNNSTPKEWPPDNIPQGKMGVGSKSSHHCCPLERERLDARATGCLQCEKGVIRVNGLQQRLNNHMVVDFCHGDAQRDNFLLRLHKRD
jgi:hypothetical protein